jgi:hypothetical protein
LPELLQQVAETFAAALGIVPAAERDNAIDFVGVFDLRERNRVT